MVAIPLLIIFGILGAAIYFAVYPTRDHVKNTNNLQADAKVTDIKTERYNKERFKTVITFSDGFQYISFKTKSEVVGLLTSRISVTPEMKMEIMKSAIAKHQELLAKNSAN